MMNKISVIIPMYNAEKTIEELLTNLSEQSFSNVEYIIVDDGSEDNSFSMVDNYIKKTKDKRFKLYHQINKGVSAARNLGLQNANGDYIIFVDCDDRLDKDFIEIKGMSTSFINLFSVKYHNGIIDTKYYVPKLLLPSVEQVLLDIMLCFEDDSKIRQFLPTGYKLKTSDNTRELLNNNDNLIYKISYEKLNEHNLAVKLTNNAFNYTITIKYL